MESVGDLLKKLREDNNLPLDTVAAVLGVDPAALRQIEAGKLQPTSAQVVQLAEYFNVEQKDLLVAWSSEQRVYEGEENETFSNSNYAEEEVVSYTTKPTLTRNDLITTINSALKNDGRVTRAWLFGSYARGTEKPNSDVDIMVELKADKPYSLFDLIDISFLLEKKIHRKVDLVEKGYLKEFALQHAADELLKVYG